MNKSLRFLPLLPLVGVSLAGCPAEKPVAGDAPYGQAAPSAPATDTATPALPPAAPGSTGGGIPPSPGAPAGAPFAGGGDPMAPLTPTPELDKAIKDAEVGGDKTKIAAAYASRGYSRMTDDGAGARVKYRLALDDFRTALKNDPTNAKAKENKTRIEEIYTSMGRPIPGAEGSGTGTKP